MIKYYEISVLEAARRRVEYIFDEFKNIFVSISSGKDSTVLYALCIAEAVKRDRKINLFFLDQEAEYYNSITLIREWMKHPNVIPKWYQVPVYMTNTTSYKEHFLYGWGIGEKWIRDKEDIAIKEINGKYTKRFYGFFEWLEAQQIENTAFIIGLRSKESLNRFRAVTKNAGYKKTPWSTRGKSKTTFRFYPIYDWTFGDIWKYIADNKIKYNKVYDMMYCKLGKKINKIRISNLIHEKSFKCLSDLQEIEPDTYDKLCERISSVHTAAIYSQENLMYNTIDRPKKFDSWKEYRDFLLSSSPISVDNKQRLTERFAIQPNNETVHRQQCRQVLLNDWENNMPVGKSQDRKEALRAKWWDKL